MMGNLSPVSGDDGSDDEDRDDGSGDDDNDYYIAFI